jgi:DNA-binding ferritin-like protein
MKESADFLLTLLHATTNTHLLHWTTKSYAEHQALGTFYEELPDLVDSLAEKIMGKYDLTFEFKSSYYTPAANGKAELESLKDYVMEERKEIPQDSEIQNEVDNIANLINQTLYLLRFP